jgi:hypothetical protein
LWEVPASTGQVCPGRGRWFPVFPVSPSTGHPDIHVRS